MADDPKLKSLREKVKDMFSQGGKADTSGVKELGKEAKVAGSKIADFSRTVARGELGAQAAQGKGVLGKPVGLANNLAKLPFGIFKSLFDLAKAYSKAFFGLLITFIFVMFILFGGHQYVWSKVPEPAKNAASKAWAGVKTVLSDPGSLVKASYGSWNNPDVVEQKPQKGVEFIDVNSNRLNYINNNIEISGRVKIDPLQDTDTVVTLDCTMPDQNGKDIQGNFFLYGTPKKENSDDKKYMLDVPAGDVPIIKGFRCIFLPYTDIPQTKVAGLGVNPVTETVVFRNAKLHAEYQDFRQRTSFEMFTAIREIEDKYADLKDSFESSHKNSDGTIQSVCIKGCGLTQVAIVSDSQPFLFSAEDTQNGYGYVYGLSVKVLGVTDFLGKISHLTSIEVIKKPDNIDFEGDGPFTGSNMITDQAPELKRINDRLKESTSLIAELRNDFHVTRATEIPRMQTLEIVTIFDYAFEKTVSVTIAKDKDAKIEEKPATQQVTQ